MAVLDRISVSIDYQAVCRKVRIPEESEFANDLGLLVDEAQSKAKPKAVYAVSFIESRTGSTVTIDGVKFESKVLRKNLEKVERVFPFVVTCGSELDELVCGKDDFLKQYWIETIKEVVLEMGIDFLSLAKSVQPSINAILMSGSDDISELENFLTEREILF